MAENKKIKNATSTNYNGINFRSRLEVSCYKKLETSGLSFNYESEKIVLWKGKKTDFVTVYLPDKNKNLVPIKTGYKLRDITYTPDFKVIHKNYIIYFDVKGHINDTYPMKKKMFIQHLNNLKGNYMFFEPHSIKQMMQAIEIIKQL